MTDNELTRALEQAKRLTKEGDYPGMSEWSKDIARALIAQTADRAALTEKG